MKWTKKLLAVGLAVFSLSGIARADTYDVSAVVPYDTPSQAATFDTSLSGLSSPSRSIRLFGTCQPVYPSSIVAVYRGTDMAGSTTCSAGGSYELQVILVNGSNTFMARTYNQNGAHGPDSNTVTVSFVPPTEPIKSTDNAPSPIEKDTTLSISSDTPFQIISEAKKTIAVTISVDGGLNPYTIELNWGDGVVETRQVEGAGTYTFTHEYSKPASYKAKASVTDVLGVRREQEFAVVSSGAQSQEASKPTAQTSITTKAKRSYVMLWWVLLGVLLLVCGIEIGIRIGARSRVVVGAKKRRKKNEKK
jgi:hypothetical protein